MKKRFYELAEGLFGQLAGDEVLLAGYAGEVSDFVRFNHSAVRQAGSVSQRTLSLRLIDGQRHAAASVALTGEGQVDGDRAAETLAVLRATLKHVPDDPYLLYATEVRSGETVWADTLPDRAEAVDAVLAAGEGRDLVGIYAAGGIFSGFANSLGQRNWFATHSFDVDASFYHAADKAVKVRHAGFGWDEGAFGAKVASAAEQLAVLARPPKTIDPGEYRVYLAPAALAEVVGMLNWGGFGLKSHRTKSTPLLKMIAEDATLSPEVTLRENTADGMSPNFTSSGYIKPDAVALIGEGRYADCLVSPRSGKEYGVAVTGSESAESLDLAAGGVPAGEAVERLGTGVYVNNLWYLNYSDRAACRITGMTRFATFWVQDGRIAAPLNVMRFDETLYRALGEHLEGLTAEREFIPSDSTYGQRATNSIRLPGALIEQFRFTL